MKLVLALFILISFSTFAEDYVDGQASEMICEEIAEGYPVDEDWHYHASESNRWKYKVQVREEYCNKFSPEVVGKKFRQVGAKKYLVGMNLKLEITDIECKAAIKRTVRVRAGDNDEPVITVSKWYVAYAPSCVRTADELVLRAQENSSNISSLSDYEIKKLDLYIPDYLELGEPDDGAGTHGYKYFKILNSQKRTVGYLTGYTYYNSEGEYATRYLFRYNKSGGFLEHKIDTTDVDFGDIF